ncbi:MAG: hypothetical protein JJ992_25055 [Planctomycetes bacterium]|nr:hypothetical protein [Planctomycetota bacterium]
MAFLIGTDEAGYGPNLGPLVIAATLWRVPESHRDDDLYRLLQGVVTNRVSNSRLPTDVPIADSKALYKSGGPLTNLEMGVYPALAAVGVSPSRWRHIWPPVAPGCESQLDMIPWYQGFDADLPSDPTFPDRLPLSELFRRGLSQNGVELLAIRARVVFAEEFNAHLERLGGKGGLLSNLTMKLVGELMTPLGNESILVHCDKHGGRNRYGPLLQSHFPEYLVEVGGESRAASRYRWGPPSRRAEFRFVAKGESFLPSALASMVAKYLRELAMKAFNHFWQQRIAGLKPTAGYPGDARRFLAEIERECRELRIDRDRIWRKC